MCSRYFLDADGNIIAYTFRVPRQEVRKRFNIAPTQPAPVVRVDREGRRELALLRWGLVPSWAKDPKVGTSMINARIEGIEARPAFREAMKSRRCIVPATGFFEWQGERPGRKQPFAITVPEMPLFAFAGLWERWMRLEGGPRGSVAWGGPRSSVAWGETVETFTIVTADANESVARIHDRMPVILPMDAIDTWLTGPADAARTLLTPYAGTVDLRPVGTFVSNVNHEGPECLQGAPASPRQQSLL